MRRSVQKEEILRMKNYKILISDSTILFNNDIYIPVQTKNKNSRTCENCEKDRKIAKKLEKSRIFENCL